MSELCLVGCHHILDRNREWFYLSACRVHSWKIKNPFTSVRHDSSLDYIIICPTDALLQSNYKLGRDPFQSCWVQFQGNHCCASIITLKMPLLSFIQTRVETISRLNDGQKIVGKYFDSRLIVEVIFQVTILFNWITLGFGLLVGRNKSNLKMPPWTWKYKTHFWCFSDVLLIKQIIC